MIILEGLIVIAIAVIVVLLVVKAVQGISGD
jgi:hypothetical protein